MCISTVNLLTPSPTRCLEPQDWSNCTVSWSTVGRRLTMKHKNKKRQTRLKTKLGLPDLEHAKLAVIVSLRSFESQRSYRQSIDEFVAWYCSAPRLLLNKAVVLRYRLHGCREELPRLRDYTSKCGQV